MKYLGSKHKLSPFLLFAISSTQQGELKEKVFCDLFAGTGSVGNLFKDKVKQVISNDKEFYAYVLNRNLIQNSQEIPNADEIIATLNALKDKEGFIYKHYSLSANRGYFSDENAKKIDAIREELATMKSSIDEDTYFFLLASLIESCDKVANTASMYGAFLKNLKASAKERFVLQKASFKKSEGLHVAFNEDANELIKKIKGDILYLDPPYNKREYGLYYHLLNTIALYDEFEPRGITGLRDYERSSFCKKPSVAASFENLIKEAQFNSIYVSYSDEGLMSLDVIKNIMQKYGEYSLLKKEHRRFVSHLGDSKRTITEYLHILKK
ncbi:MAG TPA: modification methylase [Sulfurospirillum sp. UBA12182]|nr:MAG TPA: modification methylase [Sulfurospirillum sp. UBA12182]